MVPLYHPEQNQYQYAEGQKIGRIAQEEYDHIHGSIPKTFQSVAEGGFDPVRWPDRLGVVRGGCCFGSASGSG